MEREFASARTGDNGVRAPPVQQTRTFARGCGAPRKPGTPGLRGPAVHATVKRALAQQPSGPAVPRSPAGEGGKGSERASERAQRTERKYMYIILSFPLCSDFLFFFFYPTAR